MSDKRLELLGNRLKVFRKSLGLSQREFASKISYSNTYISDIETGKANPPYTFFLTLFELFHVSMEYFFSGIGEMTSSANGHTREQPVPKELIDSGGGVKTLDQLNWLIENCPGFYHHIFGNAAEYVCRNKDIVMEAIAHAGKKDRVEETDS